MKKLFLLATLCFCLPIATRPMRAQTSEPAVPAAPSAASQPGPQVTAPSGEAAAPATPANTIHTAARLVVLDAVVLDSKGHAVEGLTRDQFHIQEDDVDQTLLNFVSPGRFTPAPEVTINGTADLDRLAPRAPVNIILLDEFNTLFEDMAFARYSLGKFLKAQPDKLSTPTMLIAVSLQKFEVLHDYTQNKQDILDALNHHFSAYPWQAHNYGWIGPRYATAMLSLRRVAEATEGHLGHKNMIWIGRGFPSVNWVRFTAVDRDNIHSAMQQTINELRDARVTLYTVDPAGVMTDPGRYGMDAALFDPFGGEPNFQKIATETGGRNLYGRNDVDAEIGTSVRDGASIYTMTYRPTNPVRDVNHFRRITVSVIGRPDLKVVTRQGYFDSRAPARLTADNQPNRRLATELAGAQSSTMVYDAVPLTVSAGQASGQYMLHTDARYLAWTPSDGTEARQTRLILTITTFDKKDKLLKTDGRAITLNAKASVAPTGILHGPIAFQCEVPGDNKAVRARIVLRVNATGRMGTADVDLLHPPPAVATQDTATPPSTAAPTN